MLRRSIVRLGLIIIMCGSLPLLALDVSGVWKCKVVSPEGEHPGTLKLAQQGEKISGAFTSDRGDFKVAGAVEGDQIHFTLLYQGGDAPPEIPFDGKVEDGKMTGQYKAGDVSGKWSAEKTP
jgi:hypothetical protein